jgi:tetratricopeptide (TPR) repeat protein
MLDCQLFGLNAGYHHLSNLFFHLLNVLLLFLLLYRMTGAMWKSGMVALLFALHPVNVDTVAWIAERKNLLSTTFWMLTMLAYVRYAAGPSIRRYCLIIIVFAIGLMAKPMIVTLPCALLLLDFWPLYRSQWFRKNWFRKEALPRSVHPSFHVSPIHRLIIEKIPLLILSFGAIWLSFMSLQKNGQIELVNPIDLRITNAIVSYLHYLWKMIWPTNLAIFYPFPDAIPLWQPIAATIALIGITTFMIFYSKRKPYIATGWFWYLGTLTPIIGIIQGGLWPQIADRWAYVPFIGVFIALVWGATDAISRLQSSRLIASLLCLAILPIFSMLTIKQLTYWEKTDILFQHTLDVTCCNYYAHFVFGQYLSNKGDHDRAMEQFQKALNIIPDYSDALIAIGKEYSFRKDFENALLYYQKALFKSPSNSDLFNNIGNVYLNMKSYKKAFQSYKEAAAIDPKNPSAYNNMGAVCIVTDQMEQAAWYINKALELDPNYVEAHYNLGLVAEKTGNIEQAIVHFQNTLQLNPDYTTAHKNLGKIFFQSGNLPQAKQHFEQDARLSPDDASAYYNIGIIFYTQQKFGDAVHYFHKALQINPGYEKAKTAMQLIK